MAVDDENEGATRVVLQVVNEGSDDDEYLNCQTRIVVQDKKAGVLDDEGTFVEIPESYQDGN